MRRLESAAASPCVPWGVWLGFFVLVVAQHACPAPQRAPLPSAEEIAVLPADGGPMFNRLIFEHSPYLLQHARNPVDWYPWGDEAFEKARAEGKLVFLSVGYATCHWCHVMEHESFEDEEVAALMNEGFVSVKVDREERPDIDEIYMTVTQAMTGSGGWPMTVILTPDRKPVFAGTYFPKTSQFGRTGMLELLPRLTESYAAEPEKFLEAGVGITEFLKAQGSQSSGDFDAEVVLSQAFRQHVNTFDSAEGGFGAAPKFPTPHRLMYLLRYWKRTGDTQALAMVEMTLTAMRLGGIYDHVGFGFHRYSVDAEWKVPHFEKMLYDQALLTMAYVEAYQATSDSFYADTAQEIIQYVLRVMTSPTGGFYSAEDADSEGEEGKFYVWTQAELVDVLGEEVAETYAAVYQFAPEGNWEEGKAHQTNIPHLQARLDAVAAERGVSVEVLRGDLEKARLALFMAREKRVHPFKDDKILTDWNGLMIAALAKASLALENSGYRMAATKAADFVLETLRSPDGRLMHRYRAGHAGLPAQQEDYAFLIWGLLELYEATFDVGYLEAAVELNETMITHYADVLHGGFYMTANDGEELLVRPKTAYDGAIPSGNSVAFYNLIRLSRLTGNPRFSAQAEGTARAFGGPLGNSPSNFAVMLLGLDFAVGPSHEVVLVGEHQAVDIRVMRAALYDTFIPNKVVLFRPDDSEAPPITQLATYTLPQRSLDGKATAYVCKNFVCSAPTTETKKMMTLLESTEK